MAILFTCSPVASEVLINCKEFGTGLLEVDELANSVEGHLQHTISSGKAKETFKVIIPIFIIKGSFLIEPILSFCIFHNAEEKKTVQHRLMLNTQLKRALAARNHIKVNSFFLNV